MEKIKKQIKRIKQWIKHCKRMQHAMNGKKNNLAHCLALMIKQIHAIEKGLSMPDIRQGFGIPRIMKMLDYLEEYLSMGGDIAVDECSMAYSVIGEYVCYHDNRHYSNKEYILMKKRYQLVFSSYLDVVEKGKGGILKLNWRDIEEQVDFEAFKNLVLTRHSIRDFSDIHVPEDKLKLAIELALHAPSACNRQTTRVYILEHEKFSSLEQWTGGVKTFIKSVDKLLIITGQMSAYENDEYWQYSVSGSIFTGYLTLALHAVGIGACVLQRSLVGDAQWYNLASKYNIPCDEQVICAIAIGMPKSEFATPLSHRLDYDRVVKKV